MRLPARRPKPSGPRHWRGAVFEVHEVIAVSFLLLFLFLLALLACGKGHSITKPTVLILPHCSLFLALSFLSLSLASSHLRQGSLQCETHGSKIAQFFSLSLSLSLSFGPSALRKEPSLKSSKSSEVIKCAGRPPWRPESVIATASSLRKCPT